jgi:putative hydrolase of the HAD superfamily
MKDNFKVVLFDLGNVVVNFDHWIAVKKISKFAQRSPEEIYQLFFDSNLTSLYEEGRLSSMDFFFRVKDILNFNIDYKKFVPIWNEIFFLTPDNLQVHRLALELKDKYKVLLISNTNELHFNYIKKRFRVLGGFEGFILSYQVKARKPDSKIYTAAIEYSCARPEQIVYIDDREDLVEAGRKMGLNSFPFKGVQELKKELHRLGIRITK